MDREKANEINPSIDKHKRHWHPKDKKEEKIIQHFLSICTEKLTYSLMSLVSQEELQKQIDRIYNNEVPFEYFNEFNTDEFFDLLIGQRRLFDDEEE